jgi:hypothetical protein
MNPAIAVDVAFDGGAPAYGGSVLKTLRDLRKTVKSIVSAAICLHLPIAHPATLVCLAAGKV